MEREARVSAPLFLCYHILPVKMSLKVEAAP